MITIDQALTATDLRPALSRFWELSGAKILLLEKEFNPALGAPVFTVGGKYTTRGWTEWTQGFQYGSALLQFDATGDPAFLEYGRSHTVERMAPHLTHFGVHDHGFNNVSTYGNLLRLMREGRIPANPWESSFYELALKVSGAVQARRWTPLPGQTGFIYSFNGPHSLFVDTIRSCRALVLAHLLGHHAGSENDLPINLGLRALQHALSTARYSVYYGEGRDRYDLPGRTAHESVFNTNDGAWRCPNSQQGYSGFSTWTRGLAWAILGFSEQLEALPRIPDPDFDPLGGREAVTSTFLRAAQATSDFYLRHTPTCGVPYWDTGAPGLVHLGPYLDRPADPDNPYEPVDASAAAIAAQGLLRLGRFLGVDSAAGTRFWQAGLTVARTLLHPPYLSLEPEHHGILLHSVYHHPNGWDHIPHGKAVPQGESSQWGDYHARELALYLTREATRIPNFHFFGGVQP